MDSPHLAHKEEVKSIVNGAATDSPYFPTSSTRWIGYTRICHGHICGNEAIIPALSIRDMQRGPNHDLDLFL